MPINPFKHELIASSLRIFTSTRQYHPHVYTRGIFQLCCRSKSQQIELHIPNLNNFAFCIQLYGEILRQVLDKYCCKIWTNTAKIFDALRQSAAVNLDRCGVAAAAEEESSGSGARKKAKEYLQNNSKNIFLMFQNGIPIMQSTHKSLD